MTTDTADKSDLRISLEIAQAFQTVAREYLAELKAARRHIANLEADLANSTAARQTVPAESDLEVLEHGTDSNGRI